MSAKKSSRGAVSKISSAASPAVSSATKHIQNSSISKSAFSPSSLQLALFASVIQGFDSEHLRIQDTSTGRLRCEHVAAAGTRITSLDWGYFGTAYRESYQQNPKKKRKRGTSDNFARNNAENTVVAFGTSKSEVCMFSPSEAKVIGVLSGVHDRGLKHFKFWSEDYLGGWSLGGEGRLAQWDLRTQQAIRTISLPDTSVNILAPSFSLSSLETFTSPSQSPPQILCASSTTYSIYLNSPSDHQIKSFSSFKHPVHTILRSGSRSSDSGETFIAADSDRFINLYDTKEGKLLRSLVSGGPTREISLSSRASGEDLDFAKQLLAVTTNDGIVELFPAPFSEPVAEGDVNNSVKLQRKSMTRRATASIRVIRPDAKGTVVPIVKASVQGPDILVACADGGVDISFQRVRWQDEGTKELLFDGVKEVVRSKSVSTLNSAMMNGVKKMDKIYVDESRTVVVEDGNGGVSQEVAIEISSGEDNDNNDFEGEESAGDYSSEDLPNAADGSEAELESEPDAEMADASDLRLASQDQADSEAASDTNKEDSEPTFGEILALKHPNVVSISDALVPIDSSTLVPAETEKSVGIPSGVSLSAVLSQSLRTNDQSLLETCFHETDVSTIRLTIQRLDSSLAGILLQKLAERLSSRPGRYGHLLVWVQWTCVAHGGAIAGRPDISSKVKSLYQVLTQRSRSLDNLLLLKGKLDMLEAQLSLRRQIQASRGPARDPDDDDVIYIEGQEEESSSDEDEAADSKPARTRAALEPKKLLHELVNDDAESEDDEEMPLTNGILHSDAEEDEFEDNEVESDADVEALEKEDDNLIDDEAEESDDDSHPSDRQEESDEEEEEEDSNEDDSEMGDFINDGPVSEAESEAVSDDPSIDVEDTPEKPPSKKAKRA